MTFSFLAHDLTLPKYILIKVSTDKCINSVNLFMGFMGLCTAHYAPTFK